MQQIKESTPHENLRARVIKLILSLRGLLLGVLVALIVAVIAYFIFTEVRNNRREDTTAVVEQVQERYQVWLAEENEAEKEKLEKRIIEECDALINRYRRSYAAQRALFTRGNLYFEKEEWQKALNDYSVLFERFSKSYLASEGIFKSAICYEELENPDEALALYQRYTENYSSSPRVTHAYFSLGRIYESKGEYEEALGSYDILKLDYPFSNWTNLGIDRIIQMQSTGKLKE